MTVLTKAARSPIRIRLARFGRRHSPQYNIVIAKRGDARDSLPIEVVGTYNPVPIIIHNHDGDVPTKTKHKDIQIDFERSKYWIGVGAEVSDRVCFLFKKAGILPETWPLPQNLTQHIQKPVTEPAKTIYEEPIELSRPR